MSEDRCDLLCLDLPRAEALRAARPTDREARFLASGFRALGDPTRLSLALALRDGEELCVCDLAWIAERAENLVSHHLRALRAAGLADYRRDGKMALYSFNHSRPCLVGCPHRRRRFGMTTVQLQRQLPVMPPQERVALERRARMLAWGGNAWHVVEFAIAITAGIAAGSVALIGFGIDSVIEALAGGVIVWLFSGGRGASARAERRAQQLIAASYAVLVAYIAVESVRDLFGSHHPEVSWVGIGLAMVTAPTMPLLARAKRKVGNKLNSSATVSEASQNMICAYLSIALLVGLLANALLGWWWADPIAALAIAAVAAKEGVESWRGETCECCSA